MGGDRQKSMVYSLQFGMQSFYDAVAIGDEMSARSFVDPSDMVAVLQNPGASRLEFLPSFIRRDQVFLSAKSVFIQSPELLLAVRLNENAIYGIDASRKFRKIDLAEFQSWAHVPLPRSTEQSVLQLE